MDLLMGKLESSDLRPRVHEYLVELLKREDNPLSLSTEEKKERALKIYQSAASIGHSIDVTKICIAEHHFLRDTYKILLKYYRQANQTSQELETALSYQKFVKNLADNVDKNGWGADYVAQERRQLARELEQIADYIADLSKQAGDDG
jgi:hypothetical protein